MRIKQLIGLAVVHITLISACCGSSNITGAAARPVAKEAPTEIATQIRAPDAIIQLLVDERRAITTRDIDGLEKLWTDDPRIIDGRGTSTTDDDYIWRGKPAVLDRYVVAVFANPPPLLSATAIPIEKLEIDSEGAAAILHMGVDRWIFLRQNQRWRIHQLIYNAPQ